MNTVLNGLEKTPQRTPIRKIEMKNFTFPLILFVMGICAGQTAQASESGMRHFLFWEVYTSRLFSRRPRRKLSLPGSIAV